MWEVGDSYGGVQAAVDANNARRDAGILHAFGLLNQGFAQRNNVDLANRNFAQQQQYRGDDLRQRALENAFRDRQERDITARYSDQNRLNREYLDLQKAQAGVARVDPNYSEAYDAVQRGLITDPDQIGTLFPSLPPEHKARLSSYVGAANEQYNQQADAAHNFASVLNNQLAAKQLKKKQAMVQALKDSSSVWIPGTPGKKEIEEAEAAALPDLDEKDVAPIAEMAGKHKLGSMVTFDPITKRFVPTIGRRGGPKDVRRPDASDIFAGAEPAANATPATATAPADQNAPVFATRGLEGAVAPAAATGYQPSHPVQFYDQVNELIAKGMPPAEAKRQVQGAMYFR